MLLFFRIGLFKEEDKVIVFIGGYIFYVESLLFIEIICLFLVKYVELKDVELIVLVEGVVVMVGD